MSAQAGRRPALDRAVALHNQGALPEAARLYQRVLRESPRAFKPAFLLGLLRVQQGDRADAKRQLQRALEIDPRHADAWFHFGEVLAAEDETAAESAYIEASRQEPPHAMACFKLGLLREKQGRQSESITAYERALTARPDFPEALNNLSNLLRAARDIDRAESALRRAIAVRADFLPAYLNLARLLELDRGAPSAASEVLDAAVKACPTHAEAHLQLGALRARMGRTEEAVQHYEHALALNPDCAEAYNNVGIVFLEQGFFAEARTCFERALERQPGLLEAQHNLGNVHSELEQYQAARTSFERAIALRPGFAEPYNGLGIVLNELGDVNAAAASFRKALELNSHFPEASANLGAALQRMGDLQGARRCYEESLRLAPNVALQIKVATMVPPIPGSTAELEQSRQRFDQKLNELLAAGGQIREEDLLKYPSVGFFLAYHGQNDRAILEKMARLHTAVCPTLEYRAGNLEREQIAGRPIRIGFVSRFFFNHSVGNFFNPIIEHLAEQPDFEVYLFRVGFREDANLSRVARACKGSILLSPRFLQSARIAIEQCQLDVLVYADIGMDRFTYLLAFSRLAPVQCVMHGHSDTSGVPALDYFISTRGLEPDDAQAQYTEKLVLLDELPMYLRPYPSVEQRRSRKELGLPPTGRLYLCPMKLHKIHPAMDPLVAGILSRDPDGRVLFFEDDRNVSWGAAVRARLARSLSDEQQQRVVFLPFAGDPARFREILARADVALDTPHHSGGTTCHMCLSAGTPIVSLVGGTARGRGPAAYYQRMGLSDGMACSPAQYIETAVGIAQNPDRRAALHAAILERRHLLERNEQVFAAYADLFRRMAAGATLPLAEPV